MPIQDLGKLHESASLRAVTGTVLRPGGFHLTERGMAFCNFPPDAFIVDVGCGMGASVAYLRDRFHFKVLGCDNSEEILRENVQSASLPLVAASAVQLPMAPGSCDGVLCECVLSLIPEPGQALAEFERVLRPGGYLIMSDLYDRRSDTFSQTDQGERESVLRSRTAIESLLSSEGFSLLAWEDQTRYLKELVAQMILSHDSLAGLCEFAGVFGSGCTGSSPFSPSAVGYYLMVARKRNKEEFCYG